MWKTKWYEAVELDSLFKRILGALLILLSPYWVLGTSLSWIDSKVTYVYRFNGKGESGIVYLLPPSYFLPFEFPFTMSRFAYLSEEPTFPVMWGATSPKLARRLREVKTAEDALALEKEIGRNNYNETMRQWFTVFLHRFVGNMNADGGKRKTTGIFSAPPLLWTFDGNGAYQGQEPIVKVEVSRELWFYDGKIPKIISNSKVFVTDIPENEYIVD